MCGTGIMSVRVNGEEQEEMEMEIEEAGGEGGRDLRRRGVMEQGYYYYFWSIT